MAVCQNPLDEITKEVALEHWRAHQKLLMKALWLANHLANRHRNRSPDASIQAASHLANHLLLKRVSGNLKCFAVANHLANHLHAEKLKRERSWHLLHENVFCFKDQRAFRQSANPLRTINLLHLCSSVVNCPQLVPGTHLSSPARAGFACTAAYVPRFRKFSGHIARFMCASGEPCW